jgi:hypothetical protein
MSTKATTSTLGRPRILDETKRREICAQVAAGESLPGAARYVGCSVRTIRRERERNEPFDQELREAESAARMEPVKAMRQAMHAHWRAAAWMLERTQPEVYGRNQKSGMGRRELQALSRDILDIIRQEVLDPLVYDQLEKRIRAAINYAMRHAWDRNRTGEKLAVAMKYFERRDERKGNPFDRPWYGAGDDWDSAAADAGDYQTQGAGIPFSGGGGSITSMSTSRSTREAADGEHDSVSYQEPGYADDMRECAKQRVRIAKGGTLSAEDEEAIERESRAVLQEQSPAAAPEVDSTERIPTQADAEFQAKLRARLTKLLADRAQEIAQGWANAERNADPPPESAATFGAKTAVPEGGTERSQAGAEGRERNVESADQQRAA